MVRTLAANARICDAQTAIPPIPEGEEKAIRARELRSQEAYSFKRFLLQKLLDVLIATTEYSKVINACSPFYFLS
jgi:hypothetical protein